MNDQPAKPTKSLKVLFADDEDAFREVFSNELAAMGHQVTACADGHEAVKALERQRFDLLIVDLNMPGLGGLEVVARAQELAPDTDVIILTGFPSNESTVESIRFRVLGTLTKPCSLTDLERLLEYVCQKRQLAQQVDAARLRLQRLEGAPRLVGDSPAIEQVRRLIAQVAPTGATVLIRGETGTGKELVARALHEQSPRADKPFVAVNCGALPENLIESELFGHRKGAFTGAEEHRQGLFEMADGGTLFLDEIGELPKAMQAKLLRVLECGEVRRIGDDKTFTVDVRLLCATHRNLEEMVERGEFRQDLLYRINTFEIHVPPLRQRREDILPLARHLLQRLGDRMPRVPGPFTPEAEALLLQYDWPGNVRELANAVEYAAIVCPEGPIGPEHLPQKFASAEGSVAGAVPGQAYVPAGMSLRQLELEAIHQALKRHGGNKSRAAQELGISIKTLYNKLNQSSELPKSA